jgi:GntR family transcriptional regulator
VLLSVDLTSDVPIYQQIRDRVVEAIAAGRLRAGDPLPSTRQLAADFGINFHTVNKAYDLLRHEGLIRVNRKSGAVVLRDASSGPPAPGVVERWEERTRMLLAEAVAHGMPAEEALDRCRRLLAAYEAQRRTLT